MGGVFICAQTKSFASDEYLTEQSYSCICYIPVHYSKLLTWNQEVQERGEKSDFLHIVLQLKTEIQISESCHQILNGSKLNLTPKKNYKISQKGFCSIV